MARARKSLTNHAGAKALALLAALVLWVLVSVQKPPDELAEAKVAVEPVWSGAASSDFIVDGFTVVPASLRIAGPTDRVSLLERLVTEPIDVGAFTANGAIEATVILPDPQLRFVDKPVVRVELKVRRR